MGFSPLAFGARMTELRRTAGLSQGDLGQILGVSHAAVSAWEQGKSRIYLDTAIRVAEAFGVTVDEMCGGDVPDESAITARQRALLKCIEAAIRNPELLARLIDQMGSTLDGGDGPAPAEGRRLPTYNVRRLQLEG